jgi:hypothetical protein
MIQNWTANAAAEVTVPDASVLSFYEHFVGTRGPDLVTRCRKAVGDSPVVCRKALVKALGLAKPTSRATSKTVGPGSASRVMADRRRSWRA